jgi:hypothetical protein
MVQQWTAFVDIIYFVQCRYGHDTTFFLVTRLDFEVTGLVAVLFPAIAAMPLSIWSRSTSESSLKKILLGALGAFLVVGAGASALNRSLCTSSVGAASLGTFVSVATLNDELPAAGVAGFVDVLGTRTLLTTFFFFGGWLVSCSRPGCTSMGSAITSGSKVFLICSFATLSLRVRRMGLVLVEGTGFVIVCTEW